jgi:V/A-type H+-transporting ATPase subunit I
MSVVRMRHLKLLALTSRREEMLRDLSKLGILEIGESAGDEELIKLTGTFATDESEVRSRISEIKAALAAISRHAKIKSGLFAQRIGISADSLFDIKVISEAIGAANEINDTARDINALFTEEGRLINRRESLMPWEPLDVPLETESGDAHIALFGMCPADYSFEDIRASAEASAGAGVFLSSSDSEQHYIFILAHKENEDSLLDALREYLFSQTRFKDITGTAKDNIKKLDSEIKELREKRDNLIKELSGKAAYANRLMTGLDALEARLSRETAMSKARATEKTFMLEGWFPKRDEEKLTRLLEKYGCAFEIRDPEEGENPPVLTYNTSLVAPFGAITEMYSSPSYSEIDPNPFLAVFFTVFFGIMLSDAVYGLILALIGVFALIRLKPTGTFRSFMKLAVICGISTVFWGVLFGGYFGDAVGHIYYMATGKVFDTELALWFNPLADPIKLLLFSLILGAIQIVTGMAINAYAMIRDGRFWDAVFDIGLWWILFAGIVIAILGSAQTGLALIYAGAGGIILTHGRHNKGVFKKLTGGLGSLYGVTSYLGDILSYSRLLALSLATAVIAQVINTMGALAGAIGFIIIFIIGHVFNISVNLIGTFVHSARLQYVEFFGKFFQGGGSPFKPLRLKTKYVDILKEDN